MTTDYEQIKADRGPELTRILAAHEIGHAYTVIALGNRVEYVTLMPDGVSAGRCVRRGAKSKSLNSMGRFHRSGPLSRIEECSGNCSVSPRSLHGLSLRANIGGRNRCQV